MTGMQVPFFIACGLLLAGFVVLARLRFLQRLFVPASVIAGAIGFGLVQWAGTAPRSGWLREQTQALSLEYRSWPQWLIAVVFAAMLLERPATSFRDSLRRTASEGIVVWIIVLGQLAVGLLVTWLLLGPAFGVPLPFGQLLEVGWAGGFGSAAAWGTIYDKSTAFPAGMSFPQARDLGVFFAASGLLYGVVSGLVLGNIALRRRWTRRSTGVPPVISEGSAGETPVLRSLETTSPSNAPEPQPMAFARVRREMIDPLAFQGLILAAAFVAGVALQNLAAYSASSLDASIARAQTLHRLLGDSGLSGLVANLPLFLFTLIGGLIVREAMYMLRIGHLIDPPSLHRITGAGMEFLIVAAIVSMRLSSLVSFGPPALILMIFGSAWCIFTLLWVSPRLLSRSYWFELGIINYEMATATTAQGLMLLRIVDPELTSGAAEDYAMAAPLSAPFIGGGIITLLLPAIYGHVHVAWIIALSAAGTVGLYAIGRRLARTQKGR